MAGIKSVLVTGANGFIGSACCGLLLQRGYQVVAAMRNPNCHLQRREELTTLVLNDIGDFSMHQDLLSQMDAVVHLAGRAHFLRDTVKDPLAEFRRVNVQGTEHLLELAAKCGVKRFIYVSTVKVNGERTQRDPFKESDPVNPQDGYAASKWEAEQLLTRLSLDAAMTVIIVRPPAVYGPGVKGNLLELMKLIYAGIPLPLAGIDNRRSFVAVENLADFLARCLTHSVPSGEVFFVSDGETLSTPELIRRMSHLLGKRAKLLPLPVGFLRAGARLLGKGEMLDKLCSSLEVCTDKAKRMLDWHPSTDVDTALAGMVEWFLRRHPGR